LGAGAHGYINNCRVVNHRSPKGYVKRLRNQKKADPLEMDQDNKHDFRLSPACIEILKIDKNTEMSETMIMGLRLVNQGIEKEDFQSRFGISLEDSYGIEIKKLVNVGLLEWIDNGRRIRLTTKGRLLGNQVFMEFV
jgi:oxygen-independent coproporphyrinogen-3 oxidase